MKASTHGHLIRRVRIYQKGITSVSVYTRSAATDEELLALAEELQTVLEDKFFYSEVNLTLQIVSHNILYRSTWNRESGFNGMHEWEVWIVP